MLCLSTLGSSLAGSYTVLMLLRVLQGLGDQLGYVGAYIWLFELTPFRYRTFFNSWMAIAWVVGYPTLVSISYYVYNWRYICVAVGTVQVLCQLPLLLFPDSPLYLMSRGRYKQASRVLKQLTSLAKSNVDLEGVDLEFGEGKGEEIPVLKQVREFAKHPGMFVETGAMCWDWFVSSLLFYGLAYGWDKFGDSLYVTYLYVAVGELIANVGVLLVLKLVGRKTALLLFYTGGKSCGHLLPFDHACNLSITAIC